MKNKQPLTLKERILVVLKRGPVNGQAALGSELGLKTLAEWNDLAIAIRYMLMPTADIVETKRQLEGTGMEGPPVFDYIYSVKK